MKYPADEEHRATIGQSLKQLLADTYTLYVKTQGFHWNVTGPHFVSLHTLFEQQYTELTTAVDEIAERIRALGYFAPGSFSAFATITSIEEADGVPDAMTMVRQLAEDHIRVAETAKAVLGPASQAHDEGSVDIATARIAVHEKTAWMLRSFAGEA